ncbi:MAG: hypothetical protein SX243_09560 [Acidobacteriota bacterium]|nr:hypothetical protein [Acidobacteriota bacterium]
MLVGPAAAETELIEPPDPTEQSRRVHVVERGESLSEIASAYYGSKDDFRLIQWANRLLDENHITTGEELTIPSASFFLEPHGLKPFSASLFHRLHSKTGELFVGLYTCETADDFPRGECPLSARGFVVTRLGRDGQNDLVFDRASFLAAPEAAGELGEFEFIDLDGDGDVDILGEWSQGSANVTTHVAYHYQQGSYTAHGIHSISLGSFETRRGPDGAVEFVYYPRLEDEALVVPWNRGSATEAP